MAATERPAAIRANSASRTTLLGRRKRIVRFDARYDDGRIELDVNIDRVLDGRHLPADAWATREAAIAECPEDGSGSWVEYATGRLLS